MMVIRKNIKKYQLTISSVIKVPKRFYPGPERGHVYKVLNIVTEPLLKKTPFSNMQHSIAILEKRLLTNKVVFLKFCDHFKDMSLPNLLNDTLFIEWVHKCVHEKPTLYSRAFQLALEVTYNKRRFNQKTLQEFYENDFVIKDNFNINQGICEQSTIFSCVLAKRISDFLNLDKRDIIVNSTPIFMNKSGITFEKQKIMDFNKKITDNSMPDITVQDRPYDFKESNKYAFNKNNVHFLTLEQIEEKGWYYLSLLEQSLKNQINTSSSVISLESKKYAESVLNIILKSKNQNAGLVLKKINIYIFKTQTPPKDFRIPMFVESEKANSDELKSSFSDEQIAHVDLSLGDVNSVKAKKALDSIQENWDLGLVEKVKKAISGSLSHILHDNDQTV